ncbi:LysR substrate-binding domain-containing protein [Dactylosporangium sp. CA-152071]|uniref:LysR substrate-binding domain-containing protein n=1 Tax=Dactylosporangium sp. CA-152071 TaxID=3239933 RepID=UPI003D8FB56E
MVPTVQGAILVERARRALHELERARAEIAPESGDVTGVVRFGILESVVDVLAAPLVEAVAVRHPGIELRLLTAYSGHLQQWLDVGDVDLSLLYNLAPTPALAVFPLVEERLWAAAPPDAGLSPDQPIRWADLWRRPLALPVPGHGLRALIDRARAETAAELEITVEVNSMRLQKLMVLSGHGWTVLPAAGVAGDVADGLLSAAPLAEPATSRSLVLGLPRTAQVPRSVNAVAAEVVRVVRRQVRSGRWPTAHLSANDAGAV